MHRVCKHSARFWYNNKTKNTNYTDVLLHTVVLISLIPGPRYDEVQKMKIGSACLIARGAEIGPLVLTIPVEIKNITNRSP